MKAICSPSITGKRHAARLIRMAECHRSLSKHSPTTGCEWEMEKVLWRIFRKEERKGENQRGGPASKSPCCSDRGSKVSSQYPCQGESNSSFWNPQARAHTWHVYIETHEHIFVIVKMKTETDQSQGTLCSIRRCCAAPCNPASETLELNICSVQAGLFCRLPFQSSVLSIDWSFS